MQPHVDADFGQSVGDERNIRHVKHQVDVPAATLPLKDNMLDSRLGGQRAVKLHLQAADVLHVEHGCRLGGWCELATVAVGVFEAVEALCRLVAWVAGRLTRFHPPKERGVRFVQPPQEVLQAAGVQQDTRLFAPRAQVRPLFQRFHAFALRFPGVATLVERGVVDLAALFQQQVKSLTFGATGVEAVFVGAYHRLLPLLFVDVASYRFRTDVPCRADVVRARPQRWQAAFQAGELFPQSVGCCPLQAKHNLLDRQGGRKRRKQVNVVGLNNEFQHRAAKLCDFLVKHFRKTHTDRTTKHRTPKLWRPDEVVVDAVLCVPCSFIHSKRLVAHLS